MQVKPFLTILLIVALVVSNAVWASIYVLSSLDVTNLREEVNRLNALMDKLVKRNKELEELNENLTLQLKDLSERYKRLVDLVLKANETYKNAVVIATILEGLNKSISRLAEQLQLHTSYTETVKKLVEPSATSEELLRVTGVSYFHPKLVWRHLKQIYDYVLKKIGNSPDHPIIVIKDIKYVKVGGKKYVYSFTIAYYNEYIQSASETLARRAGDCEDKAILLTSMYKEYLGEYGDSWVLCLFSTAEYSHCVTIAYVKTEKKYVIADPTLDFYLVTSGIRDGVDQLLSYLGLKWSDVDTAVLFNNVYYLRDTLAAVIGKLEAMTG